MLIKPCFFCNSYASYRGGTEGSVECDNESCMACGPMKTRGLAVKDWNRMYTNLKRLEFLENKSKEDNTKPRLTDRQAEVLRAIAIFINERHKSPTSGELACKFNVSDTTIKGIIEKLVEKGYITKKFKKRRSIEVIRYDYE